MSRARILDDGQCDPDHSAIRAVIDAHFRAPVPAMIEARFEAAPDRAMFVDAARRVKGVAAAPFSRTNPLRSGRELVP